MTIEHDEEWLRTASFDGLNGDRYTPEALRLAKAYHQHMRDQEGERVASTIYQAFGCIDPEVLAEGEWERVMDWLSSTANGDPVGDLLPVKPKPEYMKQLMKES